MKRASVLLCFLLLLSLLLSGCQGVKDTAADEEAAAKAGVSATAPALDESGGTTVPDAEGDVVQGNTKAPDATGETAGKETAMKLTVGKKTFTVTLENNETAKALMNQLPLDLVMSELNGNEKYYYYSELPSDPKQVGTVRAGDVMLYGGNTLVIFYETFRTTYPYTRIGAVDDPSGLAKALGSGDVRVEWSAS